MFYCEFCRIENNWPRAIVFSMGDCECCSTPNILCHDCPSPPTIGHWMAESLWNAMRPGQAVVTKSGRLYIKLPMQSGYNLRGNEALDLQSGRIIHYSYIHPEITLVQLLHTNLED